MSNNGLDFVQQLRQKLFGTTVPQPIATIATDKTAQRTFVRGSDGKMRVQFQDANTGAILGDLAGYTVIEQGENLDWLTDPGSSDTATADAVTDPLTSPVDAEMEQLLNTGRGGDGNEGRPSNGQAATVSNNFGYIDKSSLVGLAGLAPGPVGMGAKMLSTGINLNNVQAVNAARKASGLPSLTAGQMAAGVLGTNEYDDGYIGDVQIGKEGYPVSLGDALTEDDRTTLTVAEMRQRNELASQAPRLSTEDEATANVATYEGYDLDPGMVGNVANKVIDNINTVTRDIGSLFGWAGTEISKVSSEAARDVTPTRVAEAVRTAKTTAVDRAGLAPVGAIGRQRDAVDQAPANASSVPTDKSYPAGLAGIVSNTDINPNAVDTRQKVAGEVNWGSVDPRQLDPGIRGTLENAASQLGFGFSVTSGYRDPAKNAAVEGAKKSAHMSGQAVDVSLKGLDEGQRTALVGTLSGIAEETGLRIGAYSGNTALHVDTADTSYYDGQYGPAAPMYDRSIQNMAKAPGWFTSGLANPLADVKDVPTPTPRDAVTPSMMTVENALAEAAAKRERQPGSAIPGQAVESINPQTATPAQLSNMGFGPERTPNQIQAMSRVLSGELAPETIQGVLADDPASMAEMANIVSTMENRAQSRNFAKEVDPVSAALNADMQYSALNPGMVAQTDANYAKYGQAIAEKLEGYYTGAYSATVPDATHYANMDVADPAWGGQLQGALKEGFHTFGSLADEYGPSTAVQAARDAYGHSITEASLGVGFAGKANSARSIDAGNNAFEGPDQSSGFAGFQGAPRSISQADDTDYSGNSSSGYAGKSGSARSVSQGDDSFDSSIGSSGSSGFAGSSSSPRSASSDDGSFDGNGSGGGSKASISTGNRDYSGSSGSSGSGQQGVSKSSGASSRSKGTSSSTGSTSGGRDYGGSSGSSGSNQQGTAKSGSSTSNSSSGKSGGGSSSGGFAGSAGSAAAAGRGDSNVSGNGSSSEGGKSSDSGKSGGLGSW